MRLLKSVLGYDKLRGGWWKEQDAFSTETRLSHLFVVPPKKAISNRLAAGKQAAPGCRVPSGAGLYVRGHWCYNLARARGVA